MTQSRYSACHSLNKHTLAHSTVTRRRSQDHLEYSPSVTLMIRHGHVQQARSSIYLAVFTFRRGSEEGWAGGEGREWRGAIVTHSIGPTPARDPHARLRPHGQYNPLASSSIARNRDVELWGLGSGPQ